MEASSQGEYGVELIGLGLLLGVLTIRTRYQQNLGNSGNEIAVTGDFLSFQQSFMSECSLHNTSQSELRHGTCMYAA